MTYIDHDNTDPCFNFAAEEYFMDEKDVGGDSLFMFWRTKPTLMVGRFQNTVEEINQAYVREHGIAVVRRNSGGGTIYTDEGAWQFSFIIKNYAQSEISFQSFTRPIADCLKKIGIQAEFGSRNDLMIGGKKFSGNAQYRKQNAMIHHGSVLFDTDLSALTESLNVSKDKIISKGIKSVREHVTNVAEHLRVPVSAEAFKTLMVEGILRSDDRCYKPSLGDIKRIEQIADSKFRTWEWNYGRSPAFGIERKKRFAAGGVQVKLNVVNGIIEDCKIFGDFFESGNIAAAEQALCGIPYTREAVAQRVDSHKLYENFYLLGRSELIESIIE